MSPRTKYVASKPGAIVPMYAWKRATSGSDAGPTSAAKDTRLAGPAARRSPRRWRRAPPVARLMRMSRSVGAVGELGSRVKFQELRAVVCGRGGWTPPHRKSVARRGQQQCRPNCGGPNCPHSNTPCRVDCFVLAQPEAGARSAADRLLIFSVLCRGLPWR
eukprot:scaffold25703_cov140-Isochrysis_galbana.AAC.4